MVMIKDEQGIERFTITDTYRNFLLRAKQKINEEDQEVWLCYFGDTGSGKSLRAQKDKYVINPNGSIKEICFDRNEFINAVIAAKKGDVIIADEAVSIFFSRSSMTKEGRLVAEISNQIRQNNLCIMLCIPDPLALDWIILNKLNAIMYVYEDRQKQGNKTLTRKGNCAVFPELKGFAGKTNVLNYLRMKRRNPTKARKPQFAHNEAGNFVTNKPWYPFGEAGYRAKKESVLKKYMQDTDKGADKPVTELTVKQKAIYDMKINKGKTFVQIAEAFGMPLSTTKDYYYREKAGRQLKHVNIDETPPATSSK